MKQKTGRKWVRAVVAGMVLTALSLPASAETLSGALARAYDNSNLLEQNRALLRVEDEDVGIALAALRPQINALATVGHDDFATGGAGGTLSATIQLSLDLLLWDSGATALGVESAKETVLAARQGLVDLEQQVLLTAVTGYVSVLRDARVVALDVNNVRLIEQELRAARDRFEVGEVTRTDVAQAEARLAEVRGELAQSQGDLAVAQALYRAAIGVDPSDLAPVTALPALPSTLEEAQRIGERRHPSIRQAQHEIKANELNVAQAKANTRPTISFDADAGHSRSLDNNSSVGLTMTVPIYQGGQLRALTRRANALVHSARANLSQEVLLVRQSVSYSWATLMAARAVVVANDRQIRAAQIAFEGAREEAKLGARTTLDVLDTEQDLQDARTARIVSETAVFIAAYQLLSEMGLLTADELGLAVQAYDPSEYYNAAKSAPVPVSKSGKKLNRILKRYE